jgi:hypothetical protein
MNNDVRNEHTPAAPESAEGPLRHFRLDRRAVLASLAGSVGAVVISTKASAEHVHHVAAAATSAAPAPTADSGLLFFDRHSFETLTLLSEQIVPGSQAAQVPQFLDRLLAVESTVTQKRFMQAIGAFEREAREAHGTPWKTLNVAQSTALLTKISTQPSGDPARQAFDGIKGAVAETYFATEAGLKELGWNGGVAFAAPAACG